mgnify:CR=1 FL=1
MKNAYDILKERGFIEQTTDETAIRRIFGQKKITAYIGFDPTAPSFHVGNLASLMTMVHLQKNGHKPIILFGGGTGLVGDPSGKDKVRPLLGLNKVKENALSQKNQVSQIINLDKKQALFLNNADWLAKLNYIEFLREIGVHFSINRLLTAESIKIRLKTGISFLEFSYQLLQAYDFWYLFKKYDCVLQLGGSDQWGNIVAGIDLIRRKEQKEAYGITIPLLTTASGKKMGKTETGAVWLDPKLTSPYEYYQYWINTDDRDVVKLLLIFTLLSVDEINKYKKLKGEKLRQAKEILAYEATKFIHGEEETQKAKDASSALFNKKAGGKGLVPTTTLKREEVKSGIPAYKLFVAAGLAKSNGEAQRLIKQGGAYLNEEKITEFNVLITESYFKNGEVLLRAGKKKYQRLKLN